MNEYLENLPKSLFAGMVIGVIATIASIAYAALIFHGELSHHLMIGASSCLIGSIVLIIILSGFSSSKRTIGQVQDVYAAIATVICFDIATNVEKISSADVLPTIIVAIMIMSISSGLCMFLLGQLKLGNLIRYFPYPVIGGFLAGTGWLIFCQCFNFLTTIPLTFDTILQLLDPEVVPKWLFSFLYAFFMVWITRRSNHYLVLPGLLIAATILFYLYLLLSHQTVADAAQHGWMMGPFPEGTLANIPSFETLHHHIHWSVITYYLPNYLTLTTLAIISLLLNVSSFEIMSSENMDINRELKVTGVGNIIAGLLGGLGGYQGLAISRVNLNLKLNTRLIGIISGIIIAIIMILGTSILSYLPKPAFGALLIYIAFDFMLDWLIDIKKKISWPNYFIVLTITFVIAFKGFLTGLFIGLILSLIVFIIRYSSIEVIRAIMTGDLIRSTVERNESEKTILNSHAKEILIPIISGYLFFGNTAFIMNKIIDEIHKEQNSNIKYIILDFSRVTGMEVSCFMSLIKLLQFCKNNDLIMVFADLPIEIKKEINRFITASSNELVYYEFRDLDHAIEWCENEIIDNTQAAAKPSNQFQFLSASNEESNLLLSYFQKIEVAKDEIIYDQGDSANDLIYLAQGNLAVYIGYGTKHQTRLTKIKEGAIAGEMGLFLKEPRSATVIASEASIIYQLTDIALERLYAEQPDLGITLDKLIIKLLGRRIQQANKYNRFVKMSI